MMIRRFFWFTSGVVAGISTFVWSKNRVADVRDAITPGSIAKRLLDSSVSLVHRLRQAIAAGREVMRANQGGTTVARPQQTRRHIASRRRDVHR